MTLENLRFVGMDLSLTGTGLVCIDGNGKVVSSKLIQTKPTKNRMSRLLFIKNNIWDFLKDILFKDSIEKEEFSIMTVTAIALEGFSYGSRGTAVYELGMLGGIVRCSFYENSYDYVDYPPTFVKKFITGKGNAKKDLMIKEVFKLGFDADDSNIADAFALAYIAKTVYLAKNNVDQKLNANQKVSVEKYLRESKKDENSSGKNPGSGKVD